MKSVKKYLVLVFLVYISNLSFSQGKTDLLIINRNYGEALKSIDRELNKKESADLYFKKGLVLNQLQNYHEAVSVLEKAAEMDSSNVDILVELAETYSLLGNYKDAIPYYLSAVKIQPENLVLAGKLGRNYINLKDYTKAYSVFNRIYKADTTNVYWNKQYAFCAYQRNKVREAVELYEKVIAANPRDYSSHFNLIRLYKQLPPSGKIQAT
ncbi:MAG: tetratricopeptide repeat protein, partial [Prolixibacteraceae bacterium]|nr:tetratricopeptide repeat protein [Prolixibacteraceae bacterium]